MTLHAGQNISTAVMQRRVEAHDSLDDFPTPPWATRALLEQLNEPRNLTVREPTANRGHMVKPLREHFENVIGSDIHDYGAGFKVDDYLFGPLPIDVDWTIFNPPFRLAEKFIERALETSRRGVAVIVRSAFLEGVGRHKNLFSVTRPTAIYQFTERVVMHKGTLSATGSTATAYCWIVWKHPRAVKRSDVTHFHWIAPCRKRLEKAEDYA